MFGMPGIPCIYYGSEWGLEGDKKVSDYELIPSFDKPVYNDLSDLIKKLIKIHIFHYNKLGNVYDIIYNIKFKVKEV